MEATTQPILCCIGSSVAGNPTQFVMEKLLAEAQLDWRVITVEVSEQHFAEAVTGLTVMNFSAVHFLPPLGKRAVELLFPEDPIHSFVGEVSSVRMHEGSWKGWQSFGHGVIQRTQRKLDWSRTACILLGDSVRTRSAAVACLDQPPAQILWLLDEAADLPKLPYASGSGNDAIQLIQKQSGPEPQIQDAVDEMILVADGQFNPERIQDVMMGDFKRILIAATSDAEMDDFGLDSVEVLRPSELAVAKLAYDFEAWTGQAADMHQLRDAYDEYCDF